MNKYKCRKSFVNTSNLLINKNLIYTYLPNEQNVLLKNRRKAK